MKTVAMTAALAILVASPALAEDMSGQTQQDQSANTQQNAQTDTNSADQAAAIALDTWNYDDIYSNGWSAEQVLDDTTVVDESGNEIGSVENILVGENGKILSLIAEVGGFAGIGSTDISVPWDKVETGPDLDQITIPVNEDNLDQYSLFGDWGYYSKQTPKKTQAVEENLDTGPRVWKVSDVVDDYAVLNDGTGYGYVDDLIFDTAGKVMAVVVSPDLSYGRTGPYAYPFYGYGFYPGYAYYPLNYGKDELAELDTFDYSKMENSPMQAESGQGTDTQTTGSTTDSTSTTDQQ